MKTIFIISFCLLFNNFISAQFVPTGGPEGGSCRSITRVGNEIWSNYANGIYTSTDDGNTWVTYPFFQSNTGNIASYGDTVIVIDYLNNVVQSNTSYDGGNSWNAPVAIFSYSTNPAYSDFYKTDSTLIIYIQLSSKYYISDDFGMTWNLTILPGLQYNSIFANNGMFQLLYAVDTFGSSKDYYSVNGGKNWLIFDSIYPSSNAIIIDSTIYLFSVYQDTINHSLVVKTSDFGVTWDTLGIDQLPASSYNFHVFNKKMYCVNYPNFYVSADSGVTWGPTDLPDHLCWILQDNFIKLSNTDWLMNEFSGLFHYNDSSGIYYLTEKGINSNKVKSLFANNGTLFAACEKFLSSSKDSGITWNRTPEFVNGNGDFSITGDTILGTTLKVFPGGSYTNRNICFSLDNGVTWDTTTVTNDSNMIAAQSIALLNGKIYLADYNKIIVSSDWGSTWNNVNMVIDTIPGSCFGNFTDGHFTVHKGNLFLMSTSGIVLKLDTISGEWQNKLCFSSPGVTGERLISLDDKLIVTNGFEYYISSDTGNTWTFPDLHGLPYIYYPSNTTGPQFITSHNGAWFGAHLGKIYYSFDFGNNWQKLYAGNEFLSYGGLAFINNNLFTGTYTDGVWTTAGGLNLISGNVFSDINNDGIKNGQDYGVKYSAVHCSNPDYILPADSIGDYSLYTTGTGDTISALLPTGFCSLNPSYYITNGAASNANLGIYFYPGVQDLAVDLTNSSAFHSGFKTILDATIINNGTVKLPVQLTVVLDPLLNYVSANINPSQINGNTLMWNLDSLSLLETKQISILTQVPFTTGIGTPVYCTASILPIIGDTIPSTNNTILADTVVNSFDPNEKTFLYGNYFTPTQVQNGEEMIYTIRFQNLGNYPASNILITDTLNSFLDFETFHIIASSHSVLWTCKDQGVIEFTFNNINLPDSSTDEPASHGYVKYGIKCNAQVPLGSVIDNTAYIIFDYNDAVITNTTTTTILDPTGIPNQDSESNMRISIYPNPANNLLNGWLNSEITNYELIVYNTFGENVISQHGNGKHFAIDVNKLNNGIYMGKVIFPDSRRPYVFRFIIMR